MGRDLRRLWQRPGRRTLDAPDRGDRVTTLDTVPKPIMPGAEMADLLRFHRDISWSGTIAEGGMGPGTPAMTASGSGTHTLIQDGRWVVGEYRRSSTCSTAPTC
jgi:hypothetical protein